MVERRFEVNGLTLAALEWPGDGMPVLALHGWLDNAASFIPLAEFLAGHHLLALDLPGHGHSDHLPVAAHYHLADNLHYIRGVADAMGWQRFVLLGHSMGAAIATLSAAAMPQRMVALSLIDGLGPLAFTAQQEVGRLREFFSKGDHDKPTRPFGDIAAAVQIRRRHSRFAISGEAARLLVERNLRHTEEGWVWRFDQRVKGYSSHYYCEEQVRGILAAIESPAMLLAAEWGALVGWPGLAARRAALPALQYQVLAGGHHLHMEQARQVAAPLNRFYGSLSGEVT